jgi:hypothetical protein
MLPVKLRKQQASPAGTAKASVYEIRKRKALVGIPNVNIAVDSAFFSVIAQIYQFRLAVSNFITNRSGHVNVGLVRAIAHILFENNLSLGHTGKAIPDPWEISCFFLNLIFQLFLD